MAGHGWGSRRPGPQDMRPAPGTRPATDEELACKLCGRSRLACTFSDCPGDRTPEGRRLLGASAADAETKGAE